MSVAAAPDGAAAQGGVLVVEDDPAIRDAVREILEGEGYRVVVAAHGADALEILRAAQPRPAVILLDLMMPVMDGWEFRSALRHDPALAHIPVVVVSADHALAREAAALAVAGYLPKPFDVASLLRAVRKHA